MSRRPSIHDRDPLTPPREDFDQAGETLYDSETQFTSESDTEYSPEVNKHNISRSVPRTPPRPKPAPNYTRYESSRSPQRQKSSLTAATKPNYTPESKITKLETKAGSNSSFKIYIFVSILAVMIPFVSIYAFVFNTENVSKSTYKMCSYEKLQQKYPQEDSWLWRSLKVGIESILNKNTQQPAVYLLLHHGGDHVNKLVKDIAVHSSFCFDQKMHHLEMERLDFISSPQANDYGHVIEKYKEKIKKGNVILIANLNEIPAEAARALHTICDTHSPIAKDVVIFLTLKVSPNDGGNSQSIAEDTLIELWGSKLEDYELDPLIARVTDHVIALQS